MSRKTLQELTMKDNFMFAAVLQERLAEVTDLELLDILLKKSARVNSMEEFEAEACRLLS